MSTIIVITLGIVGVCCVVLLGALARSASTTVDFSRCVEDDATPTPRRTSIDDLRSGAKWRSFGLTDPVSRAYCRHGFLLALEEVAIALASPEDGRIVAQEVGARRANVRPRGHTYEGGEARG